VGYGVVGTNLEVGSAVGFLVGRLEGGRVLPQTKFDSKSQTDNNSLKIVPDTHCVTGDTARPSEHMK